MIRPTVLLVKDEPTQHEYIAYNLDAEEFYVISTDKEEDSQNIVK